MSRTKPSDSFFFYCMNPELGVLSEEESQHCVKVLRFKKGDYITLLDGKGGTFDAKIESDNFKCVGFTIEDSRFESEDYTKLQLVIAPTKNTERLEWLVEKATEIGVEIISFIKTARTERTQVNVMRLEKIAITAMKQSGRKFLPGIEYLSDPDFKKNLPYIVYPQKFIALLPDFKAVTKKIIPDIDTAIIIGPEGDFTDEEVSICLQAGFQPLSLGKARLRTETAGLQAVSYFNWAND